MCAPPRRRSRRSPANLEQSARGLGAPRAASSKTGSSSTRGRGEAGKPRMRSFAAQSDQPAAQQQAPRPASSTSLAAQQTQAEAGPWAARKQASLKIAQLNLVIHAT